MEFNKSVSNPLLVGSIELMKEEDTPGHRSMFMNELAKAELLSPAMIDPEPREEDGKLTIAPGSKVQFLMLSTSDGRKFFMGFTDAWEYDRWKEKNPDLPTFALKLEDYASMLLRKDAEGNACPALGLAVNPFGANIILPKEMLAGLMAAKMGQVAKAAQMGQTVVQKAVEAAAARKAASSPSDLNSEK